jgi:hypothetical protein
MKYVGRGPAGFGELVSRGSAGHVHVTHSPDSHSGLAARATHAFGGNESAPYLTQYRPHGRSNVLIIPFCLF